MKKVKVGNYIVELDEKFVEKYEDATCGTIDMFAEDYVCLRFDVHDAKEATKNHSLNEIRQVVVDYMNADIEINQ